MHFIPAGRDLPEPLFMAEAVCLAVHGRPSADASLYASADGEIAIVLPHPEAEIENYGLGLRAILEALRSERLKAYVTSPSGAFVRVPRFYWFQDRSTSTEGGVYVLAEDAGDLAGQPVLVAADHLEDWKAVASAAVHNDRAENATTLTVRRPRDTAMRKGLRRFLAHWDGLASQPIPPEGEAFRRMYENWCAKQTPKVSAYGRSAFYEELARVRSESASVSTNDNRPTI